MPKPKQKLLTIQDDETGKAFVRRGPNGDGYQLVLTQTEESWKNDCGLTRSSWYPSEACFPLSQADVAELFSDNNKEWRQEPDAVP